MFTGIIETLGTVENIVREGDNFHITIISAITSALKIDQSVCHDGVCLTVVSVNGDNYTVTAIRETLDKTNIGMWKPGDIINLERAMVLGGRLDGHMVQGHVDQTATCCKIQDANGSRYYTFIYDNGLRNITIPKGSVTVNGVSLTVVDSQTSSFSVAIIPYTLEHTNFSRFKIGTIVNIEFDVIGKYVARLYAVK